MISNIDLKYCYAYCMGENFNMTICSEDDYVDCSMYPQLMLNLEYLIPVTVLLFCILLSGLIGNISVCAVIARHPVLRSETNAYLFSLAVSDLFLLVFGKFIIILNFVSLYFVISSRPICDCIAQSSF